MLLLRHTHFRQDVDLLRAPSNCNQPANNILPLRYHVPQRVFGSHHIDHSLDPVQADQGNLGPYRRPLCIANCHDRHQLLCLCMFPGHRFLLFDITLLHAVEPSDEVDLKAHHICNPWLGLVVSLSCTPAFLVHANS